MGIRETIPKRKERFYRGAIEAPVSNKNPFRVFYVFVTLLWIIALVGGIVLPAAFERRRQLSRRTVGSKQNLGQSCATFLSRIPGMQESGHPINPARHVNISACRQYNNHIPVDARDLFNECILPTREAKRPVTALTFSIRIKSHAEDHGVRLCC